MSLRAATSAATRQILTWAHEDAVKAWHGRAKAQAPQKEQLLTLHARETGENAVPVSVRATDRTDVRERDRRERGRETERKRERGRAAAIRWP